MTSRRILLTGATGFLGAHLLRRLSVEENVRVAILVRPESNRWRIESLRGKLLEIEGNVRRPLEASAAIEEFAPETVLHLAWSGVGNRFRNDFSQVEDNLPGSLALLRLCHRAGCRHWIALGSQAEYGPLNNVISEDAPTRPTTLYGAAKLSAMLLSRQLCAQLGMRFVWLRVFSTYGPMDDAGWMIPQLILSLLKGERPALTEGTQRWDYLYAADAAEAIYRAAIVTDAEGIFNLGSGEAHTIQSIVKRIRDLVDPALPLGFGEVPFRPDQVMHLQADITRLKEAVGWSPATTLADGLAMTVKWYREHKERYDI